MESDPRVMVLGLDVGKLGGVFRTTSGLVQRFGVDRVVDTPLAEASIIGASLGLALAGMVPVAEIQFLGFTAQGFHQLGPQLGKYRQRSRGRYHCQVTIRAPFGGGIRSPEFHSDAIEAPSSSVCARPNSLRTRVCRRPCSTSAPWFRSTWRRSAGRW